MSLVVTGILSDRNRRFQTEIAQQQARLQARDRLVRMREDFVSTLTHDLKTPLLGAIETLKAFQGQCFGAVTPAQQQVLATMKRSHHTSLQLLETLLDVYRNDAEGLTLHCEPIELLALAEEVASTLTELAASRRVYLSIGHGVRTFADPLQLQRVFANLLLNAINHSQRGDRVDVVLESHASHQV